MTIEWATGWASSWIRPIASVSSAIRSRGRATWVETYRLISVATSRTPTPITKVTRLLR